MTGREQEQEGLERGLGTGLGKGLEQRFGQVSSLHFVGIGGVSMQALARWCRLEGFEVSGCDAGASTALEQLASEGVKTDGTHDPKHAQCADVFIHSMAVPYDHPELQAARAAGKPILKRIELLGELFKLRDALAVTGTHGKSTTSAMLTTLLLAVDPTSSAQLGAELPLIGGTMHHGEGRWLAAEVDESDPGFADLSSKIGVVLNIEDDHIAGEYDERRNYHASLEDLQRATQRFAMACETLVLCADWPGLEELLAQHPKRVTYGLQPGCDYRVTDLVLRPASSSFTLERPEREPLKVRLSVPGVHNALNASAAISALESAGFDAEPALAALESFTGVGRRWQVWGELDGALIIDDYAHHPTEVRAMLEIAKATGRRVRAVLQPHRWVRTARHWPALAQAAALADEVLVLDIYAAGEKAIDGVSPALIVDRIVELGTAAAQHDSKSALDYLRGSTAPGDLVITLGAGDVWRIAAALVGD